MAEIVLQYNTEMSVTSDGKWGVRLTVAKRVNESGEPFKPEVFFETTHKYSNSYVASQVARDAVGRDLKRHGPTAHLASTLSDLEEATGRG